MKRLLVCLLLVGILGCGEDTQSEQTNSVVANTDSKVPGGVGMPFISESSSRSTYVILGNVVGVTDGDTITVLDDDNVTHKIRLMHIDAPESNQDFGTQAKKSLSEKVFNRHVRVEWSEKDRYERTLGEVFIDDRWINKEIVSDGFAWHYRQYSGDTEIAAAESSARSKRVGLWSHNNPIAPWDFRRGARPETSTTESRGEQTQSATVFVMRAGKKYHRSGCRYLSKSKISMSLDEAKRRYGACSVCKPPR